MISLARRVVANRTAAALALALGAAVVIIAAAGQNPAEALSAMLAGAIGDFPAAIRSTIETGQPVLPNEALRSLAKATPLLLSGLAVALALRAGLFNIGAEGQILVGGFAAAIVGGNLAGLPNWIHLPLALAAACTCGAAWAAIAGWLKAWRGTHEVIVTIMLNYVAIQLTHYLVNGPARDPASLAPATRLVQPSARLWALEGGTNFSAGFLIALVAAAGYALLFARYRLGFEIRAVGANSDAARASGIAIGRTMVVAMAFSGALAGLAGAIEVLGVHRRYLDAFSPGYGFDSIAVALLGNLHAGGIIASACLFGGISSGAVHMEAFTHTPRQIAGVIQAVIILAVAARAYGQWRSRRTEAPR
ncbi:MAG: ABC transporter permease [Chthonomonadales bacterium]|nr:ABC transporter permease [Chthonomonadales bacterium]